MSFPLEPPIAPMLAKLTDKIPEGDEWRYEPKWDGFRAIVFRDGDEIFIQSRNSKPLNRYFPELVPTLHDALPQRCVVDGEIVIAGDKGLDFDGLQLRIHPAASRVKMLAEQSPASFVAFDILATGSKDLTNKRLAERRSLLEKSIEQSRHALLTPHTADSGSALEWFDQFEGAGLDGVIAKLHDLRYVPGERVMSKIKHLRTADCVVGGYRLAKNGDGIGSLLLGLYNESALHYIGHTSSFNQAERRDLLETMRRIENEASFGLGRSPGGPSRWTGARDTSWISVSPTMVCEVAFDHLQGDRFRHAARFLRWRPDKDPSECTFDQLEPPRPFKLEDIRKLTARS